MPEIPCLKLYAGHDAGHYTLPDDVLKARDTYRGIEALPYPQPPRNSWETVSDTAEAIVDAVHAGKPVPDLDVIEKARAAERIYQDALDIMGQCQDMAKARTLATLREHALPTLTAHLRPALDETWKTYQDAYRTLIEHGETEPKRLLAAPAKVRKASDTCDLMAARYEAIAAARTDLWLSVRIRCEADPTGKYTFIRNYHTLHTTRWANVRTPWHGLSTRHFLDYMAAHSGQLWLPTPDEQAKAVEAEADLGNPVRRAAGF
ncbi:hypothetical protein ACFRIC_28865 [Streptomyces sp. NPDC056738]|uniref:hypothetical protein n=1 Tax=Streptomyces sp. NPDC056738 TaxID=3345933 RepID=UPI0036C4FE98